MLLAAPLLGQDRGKGEQVWRIEGLRNGFCILLLVDPQTASRSLPDGLKLVPAGEAGDLHPALRTELAAQPTVGTWIPSRLCLYSVDTVETNDYALRDQKGRKTQLFALWTVSAAETASGKKRDLALLLFSNNERLIRSGKLAGQSIRSATTTQGKVTDVNGVSSGDDRFQIKIGKTLVTWDGHQASDSTEAKDRVEISWASGARLGKGNGSLTLTPKWASPMVGSLKVEGKDDLAKALKTSPARFVGPMYRGGSGEVRLGQ